MSGVVYGNLYKEANQTLFSTQKFDPRENTTVKYNAGEKITLGDGFRAWYGSKFKTYLSGCGGPVNH